MVVYKCLKDGKTFFKTTHKISATFEGVNKQSNLYPNCPQKDKRYTHVIHKE